MDSSPPLWRRQLLARLEIAMGRAMFAADLSSLSWDDVGRTLTVQSPLLSELRSRNLTSKVFRLRSTQP